jgi:hypothetical protein
MAARIAAASGPGEVLISNPVRDIVAGSSIAFEGCGEHKLDGAPGTWHLFAACHRLERPDPDLSRADGLELAGDHGASSLVSNRSNAVCTFSDQASRKKGSE